MGSFKLLTCVIVLISPYIAFGQEARAACHVTTVQDAEFRFTFRFGRQTDTSFTQIAFFNSSETSLTVSSPVIDSPAACTDDTADSNGVFEVGFDVDGDATLPCGIVKNSNDYTITVVAIGSTKEAYRFVCTTGSGGNILPGNVDVTTFETGPIVDKAVFRPNKQSLRFDVFHADGNRVPSITARSGEFLQLRVTQDKDGSEGQPPNFSSPGLDQTCLYKHEGGFQNYRVNIRTCIGRRPGELHAHSDVTKGADSWGRKFHVVFLEHDNAEISLQVLARDLGSMIKVTGSLTASTFEEYYPVKRDESMVIPIRDDYRHVDQGTAWVTTKRAVKVEVVKGGDVSVRALSKKRVSSVKRPAGMLLSIPDDALGKKYNCYTGSTEDGGQALVYAVEDSTAVTVKFGAFTRGAITINNNGITADTDVTMNENEVLYIQCGTDCGVITVEADKPIGVVTGHESAKIESSDTQADHLVSQLPPVHTYSKTFTVLTRGRFRIYTEDPTAPVNYTRKMGLVENVPSGTLVTDLSQEELSFSQNVLLLLVSWAGTRSSTRPWPSYEQWATRYYLYLVPGVTYKPAFVARIGDFDEIQFLDTGGVTNIGKTTISAITAASLGNIRVFSRSERFQRAIDVEIELLADKGPALIEIRSLINTRPFMMVTLEITPDLRNNQLPVTGTRFPIINPCVPSPDIVTTFGTVTHSVPGDMQDNDCDGEIDEDIDDTNAPGPDLAPLPISPYIGINVDFLEVSNSPLFPTDGSARTHTLISGGCSTQTGTALSVNPFMWNRGIGEQFDTFHVMDTSPFRAFSLGSKVLYFRVRVGFCYGNLTSSKCDNSCQQSNGRRRRQADDTIELNAELNIEDPGENTYIGEPDVTCPMNKLYWIPAILLFLTILIEAVMNGMLIGLRLSLSRNIADENTPNKDKN